MSHPPLPPAPIAASPQHPRAPAHENAAARDASAAAARGWTRSQSSRLREKARRLEAGDAPAGTSQPQSSAVAGGGGGSGGGLSGGGLSGGVGVRGAVHNGSLGSLADGGGVAVERGRDSDNDRGKEQEGGGGERAVNRSPGGACRGVGAEGDAALQSPSSEEEACLEAGAGEGGVPSMHVVKRDGRREPVMFDKITARIRRLCWGLDERYIDPVLVAQKVRGGWVLGLRSEAEFYM